jgi:phenylpropionate dioxygenase-like ring-hydroxylating dioxygenase large terminal subunit
MVETLTGTDRSKGPSYNEIAETDSHPAPPIYLVDSPLPPGPTTVDVREYFSRDQHELEVERLWKRVWQMACHEDDIPNPGDAIVYDIASLSFLLVRNEDGTVRAFPNACLHRGRSLVDCEKKGLKVLRCPFHGWSWNLDGKLKEVPCQWDFPTVDEKDYSLPAVKVGHWGGFVFINPDPDAEPLEDFLGDIDKHFRIPFERRYKAVHFVKRLPCNWKVAQEAFMESYHVIATHPTLLPTFSDANTKYDVFGNLTRAISPSGPPSPHTGLSDPDPGAFPDGRLYRSHRHVLSGAVYRRIAEDEVEVTMPDGRTGFFDSKGDHLRGEVTSADQHLCNWIGGKIVPGTEDEAAGFEPMSPGEYRAVEAARKREAMRPLMGDYMDEVSDSDLVDSIYYSLFPNLSPWADFNPIFYRFRPDGDNPEQSLHEVMFMMPVPEGQPRPEPAKMRFLDLDDDYTEIAEIGSLAKVFNQDMLNHAQVQKGLHSHPKGEIIFANYQETKIRHFHATLDKWLSSEKAPKSK